MPSPEGKPLADVTFAHLQPLQLNLSAINHIDVATTKNDKSPQHFYVSIRDLFKDYSSTRFKANNKGIPELNIILEAVDVIYQQKESDNKLANYIGVARMDEYVISLKLNLSLMNNTSGALKGRHLNLQRIISISEHVSIAERERRQMQGVEAMFVDLDQAIIDVLRNDFGLRFNVTKTVVLEEQAP